MLRVPGSGGEEGVKEEEADGNDGGCKISGFERDGWVRKAKVNRDYHGEKGLCVVLG